MSTMTTGRTSDNSPARPTSAGQEPPPDVRRAWLLVMNREIVVRALNKTFVIGLAVTLVMMAALALFLSWQGNRTESFTVAVAPGGSTAVAAVEAAEAQVAEEESNVDLDTVEVSDAAAARAALESGDADGWLHPDGSGWTLTAMDDPDSTLTRLMSAGVEREIVAGNAAAAGTSVADLTAGSELTTERIDSEAIGEPVLFVASFALGLLFFMGVMSSGYMIAGSVVEEKQSRLAEIMATAVSLRQLLAGKILGNSVIALAQTLLFASVGLVAVSFTELSSALPALSTSLIWFVAFFVVGFVALASLYAVAGALASRTEDVQYTSTPMTMVVVAVYFVAFSASGTLNTVLSFVPPTSVVTMPIRVLSGEAAWWEPVVSLVILAAFAAVAVWVCERAYRGALLQTGGRLSWRQALRADG